MFMLFFYILPSCVLSFLKIEFIWETSVLNFEDYTVTKKDYLSHELC